MRRVTDNSLLAVKRRVWVASGEHRCRQVYGDIEHVEADQTMLHHRSVQLSGVSAVQLVQERHPLYAVDSRVPVPQAKSPIRVLGSVSLSPQSALPGGLPTGNARAASRAAASGRV